jgi:hypothetical protein
VFYAVDAVFDAKLAKYNLTGDYSAPIKDFFNSASDISPYITVGSSAFYNKSVTVGDVRNSAVYIDFKGLTARIAIS